MVFSQQYCVKHRNISTEFNCHKMKMVLSKLSTLPSLEQNCLYQSWDEIDIETSRLSSGLC